MIIVTVECFKESTLLIFNYKSDIVKCMKVSETILGNSSDRNV